MAMYADNSPVPQEPDNPRDQFAIFLWNGIPDRIRDIHSACAGFYNCVTDLLEKGKIRSGGILGGKLNIICITTCQRNSRHGIIQDLRLRFLQLVFEMDLAGGDEGMDAGPF